MTYEAPSGNWEVVVGGTNLTDERFIVTGVNQGGIQIIYGSYNRPREWFATLRIRN
jgi:iron complex outermembrane receptor protein